jgi:hypothetical protein
MAAANFGKAQHLAGGGGGAAISNDQQSEDEEDYHNMPLSSRAGIGSSSSTDTLILNQGAVPQFVSPKREKQPPM